jgi:hypothetical protein
MNLLLTLLWLPQLLLSAPAGPSSGCDNQVVIQRFWIEGPSPAYHLRWTSAIEVDAVNVLLKSSDRFPATAVPNTYPQQWRADVPGAIYAIETDSHGPPQRFDKGYQFAKSFSNPSGACFLANQ